MSEQLILLLSAPSGTGKSTIARRFFKSHPDFELSVSHTTRPPRPQEVNGRDYHFVGTDEFQSVAVKDGFIESAEVHGNHYGTSKAEVNRIMGEGKSPFLDLDVQGGRLVKQLLPETVAVFILPPSMAELEQRLRGRGTEHENVVRLRLENARKELEVAPEYDYLIVNDTVDACVAALEAIVAAERSRFHRRKILLESLREEDR
jgi:guanylate kinase